MDHAKRAQHIATLRAAVNTSLIEGYRALDDGQEFKAASRLDDAQTSLAAIAALLRYTNANAD